MAPLPKALCIFGVLLAISLQLQFSNGSVIPRMCRCGMSRDYLPFPAIKNFTIHERADACGTEILLTTNIPGAPEICLNPNKRQGSRLFNCWTKTIQKDESRKAECLHRAPKPRAGVVVATTEASVEVTKELLFPVTSTPHYTPTTTSG